MAKSAWVPGVALLLLLLAGGATATTAQSNSRLNGVVKDSATGETIPYADVTAVEARITVTTNYDGRFTLLRVPVDSFTVRIEALGYAPLERRLSAGGRVMEFLLARRAVALEAIQVTAVARDVELTEHAAQVALSPAQVAALPSVGQPDVFRALQLLPGISSSGDGSSGLYVRGGTPDQNLVLFDGMTVYHIDHFFGLFSAFNNDAIKDVRVFTAAFPARYGGRVSSVLDLTGKVGNEQRFRLQGGASLLSADAVAEVPLGKGSWLFSARRSYTDVLRTPLYDKLFDFRTGSTDEGTTIGSGPGGRPGFRANEVQVQPDFYFYDVQNKVSYRPSPADLVSASLYAGADRLDESNSVQFGGGGLGGNFGSDAPASTVTDVTDWGNRGASGRWSREWSDRWSTDVLVAASRYQSENRTENSVSGTSNGGAGRFGGTFSFAEDNVVDNLTFRLGSELRLANDLRFQLGSWLERSEVSYEFDRLSSDTLALDVGRQARGQVAGGYLESTWSPLRPLSLTTGVRASHYDLTGDLYWEPRASATIQVGDGLRLNGAWGKYHQWVNRAENEDVLEGSRDFWLLADDELPPTAAEHWVLGAALTRGTYAFSVEAYEKDFSNITLFSTRYRIGPIGDAGQLFFTGSGVARGVELLAQKTAGTLTGWLTYTLAEATNRFAEINGGEQFPATHDARHSFKLVGNYQLGRWQLGGSWVFTSGRPYTIPESQYSLVLLDGSRQSYIHVGDKNGERLPAYHRLDLSARRRFERERFSWDLGFSVFNAYNRDNVWYRQFDLSQQPITITDVSMLGLTPSIDVRFALR